MTNLTPEKMKVLRDRTMAKVLWGEHEKLTIEFLREQGLGGPEIGELMDEAKRERDRIIKRRLLSRLITLLIGLAVFVAIPVFYYQHLDLLESFRAKLVVCIAILAGTACLVLSAKILFTLFTKKTGGAVLSE